MITPRSLRCAPAKGAGASVGMTSFVGRAGSGPVEARQAGWQRFGEWRSWKAGRL